MHNIGIEFTARGEMGFCDLGQPPVPGSTQILIRTHYSGITNGTERHALMGDFGYGGRYPIPVATAISTLEWWKLQVMGSERFRKVT